MRENRSSADSHVTGYRRDLDGLRAVAVSAVIAFHLARPVFPGGYLGVDIFFVLSGYLITSIIWREILLGQFSVVNFYNRRIRRIMPALLLVVVVTAVVSIFVLLPSDFVGFGRSVFATLAFVANVYFWRDADYFSRLAEEKPMLHLWSLGVEEQFYLLFPLLLVLLARIIRMRAFTVIALLVIASLAGNFFALRVGGALPAFYLLPTRAWELGAGALLALAPSAPARSPAVATILGLVGSALVILGLVTGQSLFSAGVPDALAAVAGTVLIVWAGHGERGVVGRVLSSPGLVFVGLISYSLYLWHWPVIVLIKYFLIRDLNLLEVSAAVALMVSCATLSWRYVERPFRSLATPINVVYSVVLAGAAIAAALAAIIVWQVGFPGRLNPAAARMNASVGTNYRCAVSDYIYFSQSRACVLELPSRNPDDADLVLFGNSHAQMYAPVIGDIVSGLSQRALLVPMNGCTPTVEFNISSECRQLADRNIEAIANLKRARVVVLATTWEIAGERQDSMVKALDRTIDRLAAANKKVVLVGPIAAPNWNVASIASRQLAFGRGFDRPLYQLQSKFQAEFSEAIAHFERRQDIEFVRADRVQCRSDRCDYVIDGKSLFADGSHIAMPELSRFRHIFEAALKRLLTAVG